MLKGFSNVLLKELKELIRDPKILLGMVIVPLILFPILGAVLSFSAQTAQEQALKASIIVLNDDGGNYSQLLLDFLNSSVKVILFNNMTPQHALSQNLLTIYNTTSMLEIPAGFSSNMTLHVQNSSVRADLQFFGVFSNAGAFGNIGSSLVDALINQFNRDLAPDFVSTEKSTIIKGKIAEGVDPSALSSLLISQAIALPITIMILLTYAMQIAATSVAMEKEEKTLETLLTLPMDRFAILMGKLSGSILVAGVGALAYIFGFTFYTNSLTSFIPSGTSLDLASLGLVPSIFGYALLGISLFVTLLSALALAVILSAFAEDVRGAQSLVGYVYPLLFIPSFVLIYIDVNALPVWLRYIIYAIPFSHPIIASRAVTVGDYLTPLFGIVYVAAFTVVIMYVASRLFATEKILTAKLRFRGLARRRQISSEE